MVRVAKFDLKVGSRRTTQIENVVVLIIILTALICYFIICMWYTEYAGPDISMNSRIASLFSRQIANVSAGPVLALESMGAKRYFRCCSVNIGLMYK